MVSLATLNRPPMYCVVVIVVVIEDEGVVLIGNSIKMINVTVENVYTTIAM